MRVCQWLKRVIVTAAVYPRFLNFFTLTFRALGTHCHDLGHVMSEIECAQLHSELFRCRHSTRQSHGLFALAKPLLLLPAQGGNVIVYVLLFVCLSLFVDDQRLSEQFSSDFHEILYNYRLLLWNKLVKFIVWSDEPNGSYLCSTG